jgi:hypothetical protein
VFADALLKLLGEKPKAEAPAGKTDGGGAKPAPKTPVATPSAKHSAPARGGGPKRK